MLHQSSIIHSAWIISGAGAFDVFQTRARQINFGSGMGALCLLPCRAGCEDEGSHDEGALSMVTLPAVDEWVRHATAQSVAKHCIVHVKVLSKDTSWCRARRKSRCDSR